MLRNYFRIAWRNMIKDKQFTFLNVFGLSAGASVIFIALLTISVQAIKAALANPVTSLRSE